jgi:hypothetical protein
VRSWIRVSALIAEDDKIAMLPNDQARFAWIVALGKGKFTSTPGTWQSEAHFKASMGTRARYLQSFLDAGLMERSSGGSIRVSRWEKWQSDPTVNDRVRAFRQRVRNAEETA